MTAIYHAIITQPLLNILIFFYNTIAFRDLGASIILLTIFVRLILFPVFKKSAEYQLAMQVIQPKLKAVQEKHKEDKTKQTEAMLALYREHKLNPFSGFLFLLIQLPILIGLYRIFLFHLKPGGFNDLYSFIAAPASLNTTLLGLINLNEKSIILVIVAAALQYVQARISIRKNKGGTMSDAEKTSRYMAFVAPVLTLVIFANLPAAVSLYWSVASAFSIVQQVFINKQFEKWELEMNSLKK